jgi:hypothetical protein
MSLQPLRSWPLFQFLNPIYSRYDSFDRGSARRKAATYTQNNTSRITHASSGIRNHDPSVPAGEDALDRAATVTGIKIYRKK